MSFNLDEYRDVAERIELFYQKFPDGRLCRDGEPTVMRMDDQKEYVVYKALAYRTEDDPLPAPGTAWEPWPGATQFTRDSELMNAETAAIGRAIVMAGIGSKKIASKQEVQARRGEEPQNGSRGLPALYVDCLRLAIRSRDKTELVDDAEWASLVGAANTNDQKKALVDGLEAKLRDLDMDPQLVRDRWQAAREKAGT